MTDKVQVYYLDENGRIVPSTMKQLLELNGGKSDTLCTERLSATHCPWTKETRQHDFVFSRNPLTNGKFYKTCRYCGYMAETTNEERTKYRLEAPQGARNSDNELRLM